MNYLLDTNHASRLLDEDGFPKATANSPALRLCSPVVGELWYMVKYSRKQAENETKFRELIARVPTIPYDSRHTEAFGVIRIELRRRGRPIPQIDAQIAAIARMAGLTVLTADSHFSRVENLRVENWLS